MGRLKDKIIELNLTKEQMQDKDIQKFVMQAAWREQTGDYFQYWNGNGYCELNKKDGTMITTVLNDDEDFKPEFPLNCDVNISNNCRIKCAFCLTKDAKLFIDNKYVSINNIKEGDIVNSFNLVSRELEQKKVTHLFQRDYEGELIELYTDTGDILKLTPNHKVYTQRGYIRADELTLEDELISESLCLREKLKNV